MIGCWGLLSVYSPHELERLLQLQFTLCSLRQKYPVNTNYSFYSQGIYHTQALKSKGISCEYYCAWWRAHCPPKNNISGVVWWCQLWKRFLPAPRAPDTIFSTNADTVDNRGKGPGLSTLSSKCTHCYFLSTLLLYFQLWNIGQCVSFRVQVSDPFLTMTRRWGMMCPGTLDDGQQCA